ncbi:glycerate kinase [Brevibacterium daeguense]|uniref:Glycerate kinase n=1 Tax=Brevibacterium daeguense TaxID=909936 RepID=A0ABP8EK30_9MICO|nr:glycerate kinase [Brevibacterium daeguense]
MHILLACDKFKGTLTAAEVHAHLTPPLAEAGHHVRSLPIADGGDGTVAAAVSSGFSEQQAEVTGPLGERVTAVWARRRDTAVIEMAQASGLALIQPTRGTALHSTSIGTGELIRAALDAGCTRIVLAVGGSATTDGGAGMLRALGVEFLDRRGIPVSPGGAGLTRLARVDLRGLDPRLRDGTARVILASDVENPLLGDAGAAAVYGPQKGAVPEDVARLDAALAGFAGLLADDESHAVRPGAGAAGGVGFAAFAVLGAEPVPGAEYVMDLIGFDQALGQAELVVTGEGRFDAQTLSGKGPGAVISAAAEAAVPVRVVCGSSEFTAASAEVRGLAGLHPMTDHADLATCLSDPGPVLEAVARELVGSLSG